MKEINGRLSMVAIGGLILGLLLGACAPASPIFSTRAIIHSSGRNQG